MPSSSPAAPRLERVCSPPAVHSLSPLLEALPCLAFVEHGGVIVARNSLASMLTGVSPADPSPMEQVFLGNHTFVQSFSSSTSNPISVGKPVLFDCMLLRGQRRPIAIHGASGFVEEGEDGQRLILALEGSSATQQISRDSTFLGELLDAAPEAMAITRAGRLLHVNRQFTKMFGYPPEVCVGQEIDVLLASSAANRERENILHLIAANGSALLETVRHTHDGTAIDVSIVVGPVPLGGHDHGLFYTFRDIGPQKQAEARLHYTAMHDALTELPNRALFLDRLRATLARMVRIPERSFAVMFLDLDGFKVANDVLGHRAGDALLCEIADRLTACLRPQDVVARLGGDEFALLIDDALSVADVVVVAERVQKAVQLPVEMEAGEAKVSASIGIKMVDRAVTTPDEVIHHADIAMYCAKAGGKARHVIYSDKMTLPAVLKRAS